MQASVEWRDIEGFVAPWTFTFSQESRRCWENGYVRGCAGEEGWTIRNLRSVALLLTVCVCLLLGGCEERLTDGLVPTELSGWRADGEDGVYNRETLYDYINGAAEVYLAYGFRRVAARRFVKQGQPAITVDVFDMGSSEDAYGIFSFEREGGDVGIGRDSEYAAGFLRFWKGPFFVSILADRETAASRQTVMGLSKAIADKIKPDGARPKILAFLPPKDLIRTSIRFFHQKSGLDYHYFVADKNILGLNRETDAFLAQYGMDGFKAQLLLVHYPGASAAGAAFDSFLNAYMPEARESGVARTEDGKWVAAKAQGSFVAAVFDAPSMENANSLIEAIVAKLEVEDK